MIGGLFANPHTSQQTSHAIDYSLAAGADMDIDMDIDLGVDPDVAALEAEAMAIEPDLEAGQTSLPPDHSSSNLLLPVPEKLHLRGLDSLSTSNLKEYISQHHSLDGFVRVEWVDDTSANIVYNSSDVALEALAAFSYSQDQDSVISGLELRQAKPLPSRPDVELRVRQAVQTDVKKPRAHEASRFYLLNPDKDPRERRKHLDGRIERGRHSHRRPNNRPREDGEHNALFDVSMYDDDAGVMPAGAVDHTKRKARSIDLTTKGSEDPRRRRRGDGSGEDLFSDRITKKNNGRLRDRSASPDHDADGRLGFEENSTSRRARRRSSTPPGSRPSRGPTLKSQDNQGKELFASHASAAKQSPSLDTSQKELFPNRSSPLKRGKELFPNKTNLSNHRRTAAFDAANEPADLFSTSASVASSTGSSKPRPPTLAGRITRDGESEPGVSDMGEHPSGFTVRGTAEKPLPGYSIRGAATGSEPAASRGAVTLDRSDNQGKELFAGRVHGRGGPRRKAQDMYF